MLSLNLVYRCTHALVNYARFPCRNDVFQLKFLRTSSSKPPIGGGQISNVAGWIEGVAEPARKDCWKRGGGRDLLARRWTWFSRGGLARRKKPRALGVKGPEERVEAGHRDEYADAPRPATAGPTRAFCRAPPTRPSWQCPDAYGGVRRWRT